MLYPDSKSQNSSRSPNQPNKMLLALALLLMVMAALIRGAEFDFSDVAVLFSAILQILNEQ